MDIVTEEFKYEINTARPKFKYAELHTVLGDKPSTIIELCSHLPIF